MARRPTPPIALMRLTKPQGERKKMKRSSAIFFCLAASYLPIHRWFQEASGEAGN